MEDILIVQKKNNDFGAVGTCSNVVDSSDGLSNPNLDNDHHITIKNIRSIFKNYLLQLSKIKNADDELELATPQL